MWQVNWATWHERRTKKKFWVPNRYLTHDLPNTGRTLYSYFITERKIQRSPLYSLIVTHNDFESADPSSMQDTCHISTQLNDLTLHKFS